MFIPLFLDAWQTRTNQQWEISYFMCNYCKETKSFRFIRLTLLKAKPITSRKKKKNRMEFRMNFSTKFRTKFRKKWKKVWGKKIQIKCKKWPFSSLCYKMIYVTAMSSVSSPTCFAFNFREPSLRKKINKTGLSKYS